MADKKTYMQYRKFDVIYADLGKKPHGVEGGVRPCIVISCDMSNHRHAPQISVVPLSSKLKNIPVHVPIAPGSVRGHNLKTVSDFMPEDVQTLAKGCVRGKSGYIPKDSETREQIDRALIRQFDLLPAAKKMVMEELAYAEEKDG